MTDSPPPFPTVETQSVVVEMRGGGVAVMRIESEPLGVLRLGVKRALQATLHTLESDPDVRAVVITGKGRAFSVGSDIREFEQDVDWQHRAAAQDQELYLDLEASRLPVIAACNGLTLGGGNELAIACDIRLASASARFGFPEVKVAAFASAGGTQRLPQIVGAGRAMALLLTGRVIDAQEAAQIGLVEEVLPDDELEERAVALATEVASLPALAIEATKRAVVAGLQLGRQAGRRLEDELMVELALTPDAAEGQAAFLEKRAPRFSHRARSHER